MFTLTFLKTLGIAILFAAPVHPAGIPATFTDLFGSHQLNTEYGLMNIQVGVATEGQPSTLAIGEQYLFIKNAPLIRILEFLDLPLSPCPLTFYDFGQPTSEDAPFDNHNSTSNILLAEQVSFKISCSDCALEHLQEVAAEFLNSKLETQRIDSDYLPVLSQGKSDQTNR